MPANRHLPMAIWAAREIQRHPGRALLLFAALASLVCLTATHLLFSQALDTTWARLMQNAPDLVVRRVDSGGWTPLPIDTGVSAARRVPGVTGLTPRLWGVASGPEGPVTVVTAGSLPDSSLLDGIAPPAAGQAVVGQGVWPTLPGNRLSLTARAAIAVEITGRFPPDTSLATVDLVWLTEKDTRRLLGIPSGQASDLAVRLFRREEEQAIQADLAAAMPWPVRITDRSTSALRYHTRAVQTGASAMLAVIPCLLALLLIVTAVIAENRGQRARQGLLKAMGWTTADIVRLQLFKALIVALPALLVGLATAYGMVFWPPLAGVTAMWITGGTHLPALALDGRGAGLILLEMTAMVGLPYLAAVFLTTLRGAANDPGSALQDGPWN
ncbi:hypothetical protein DSCO28_34000 [Desulfosarcina ovata subsp. sediminis]|uniref:ABC transporter permease n=1 Tax=Desulfosarcina ovata subsp. sediminis TaxID=885957 RepID=A0A5K7ZMP0_9BACT|nr:ABC transporter permease [Desulfosarcina ovata]BBO82834.1 hypothetical protein DSCO28_34000 [Desulfosarcina ovata subsp. sediminis]